MTTVTHLLAGELAVRLRTTEGTLQNWRTQGKGPKFMKLGRRVLYPLAEVEAYEQQHLKQNTAQ